MAVSAGGQPHDGLELSGRPFAVGHGGQRPYQKRPNGKLVRMVRREQPDLLFTEEVDAGWDKALDALRHTMPYSIEKITGGPFSSQLQSRLPLVSPQIRHLGSQSTPQVVAGVRLRSGEVVQFLGIHPRPPYPSQSALGRDAVLMKAGLIARSSKQPTVLGGDLNGTPWENAIDRMQRIARFIDPRQGYGYLRRPRHGLLTF